MATINLRLLLLQRYLCGKFDLAPREAKPMERDAQAALQRIISTRDNGPASEYLDP
jgi:hypothetical protein